ncbi:MAG TPA: HNH endonuclease signature motif containing protein [Bacteriovoracaceae bacterium]|nr:HNH endonuclease signature motif containing protein [Bacteriovoracaceae bacterium]
MQLKHLTDNQLLKDTSTLVQREREITTKILHHLKEIDRRKLYCDLKCSSLYDYCTRILGLSEASAQRRIQSARLLGDLPEIESKIEDGDLSLSNLAQAVSFFKQQDITTAEEKKIVLNQIEKLTKKECEKKLFEISGVEIQVKETKKRVAQDKSKVVMVLSDETLQKLDRLKALMGKNLSQDELINLMADIAILKTEKEKFKVGSKIQPPSAEVMTRYVSASTKRQVYLRDKGCTQCGSSHRLNFDHREPFSLGGKNSSENIRLLCFQCNQRARIRARL